MPTVKPPKAPPQEDASELEVKSNRTKPLEESKKAPSRRKSKPKVVPKTEEVKSADTKGKCP